MILRESVSFKSAPRITTINDPLAQAVQAMIGIPHAVEAAEFEIEFQSNSNYRSPKNVPARKWFRVWLSHEEGADASFTTVDLTPEDAAKLRDYLSEALGEQA